MYVRFNETCTDGTHTILEVYGKDKADCIKTYFISPILHNRRPTVIEWVADGTTIAYYDNFSLMVIDKNDDDLLDVVYIAY